MTVCAGCGRESTSGEAYCPDCGTQLVHEDADETQHTQALPGSKRLSWTTVLLICVVAVLCVGTALALPSLTGRGFEEEARERVETDYVAMERYDEFVSGGQALSQVPAFDTYSWSVFHDESDLLQWIADTEPALVGSGMVDSVVAGLRSADRRVYYAGINDGTGTYRVFGAGQTADGEWLVYPDVEQLADGSWCMVNPEATLTENDLVGKWVNGLSDDESIEFYPDGRFDGSSGDSSISGTYRLESADRVVLDFVLDGDSTTLALEPNVSGLKPVDSQDTQGQGTFYRVSAP